MSLSLDGSEKADFSCNLGMSWAESDGYVCHVHVTAAYLADEPQEPSREQHYAFWLLDVLHQRTSRAQIVILKTNQQEC